MARVEELSVDEIRKRYLQDQEPLSQQVLNRLRRDSRQGVQRLYATLARRFEKERDERVRLDAMRHFERVLWKSGIRDIAGVDDSKRLDAPTRERLAIEIRAKASGVAVGIATVEDIDRVNIYHASLLAMRRAVEGLPRAPQHVLVDARTVPGITMPQNSFNKGDGINFTIAAASIIAKTARDAMMQVLDREYPGYGFATHKGYPTPDHREALLKLGRSRVHRMSFPVLHEWFGEYSPGFYALKTQLFEAQSRAELGEFENALKARMAELTETECKKLRLLVGRRWKAVAA